MEKIRVKGITLFIDQGEQETAELLREAIERSVPLLNEHWGLETPRDCRVYVMTSWIRFLFRSSPWYMQIFLAGTMPLWFSRNKKHWKIAAGWTLRYKHRPAVGVKPARLIQAAQRKNNVSVFAKEDDPGRMVQNVACHELVHAFTAHLKLPLWLNEGLAMVTVDKFAGKPTVNPETVEAIRKWAGKTSPGSYRKLDPGDIDGLVYHFVRGYWMTRYFEDNKPELLMELLRKRYKKRELEHKVAQAFGMTTGEFWRKIDGIIAAPPTV